MDINQYAELYAGQNVTRNPQTIIGKNQQLWDLGTTSLEMEDMETVEEQIARYDSQFDLVLIMEYFDESLVLLAELLCWDLSQVRLGEDDVNILDSLSLQVPQTECSQGECCVQHHGENQREAWVLARG